MLLDSKLVIKIVLVTRSYLSYTRAGQTEVTVAEDDFVLVQAVTKPWMADTLLIDPTQNTFGDGHISLVLIKKGKVY